MNAPFRTPQAIADELLRVDQARRIREAAARHEARQVFKPLSERRDAIEEALEWLYSAEKLGAGVSSIIERCEDRLIELQREIDETMRQVAIRHQLFVSEYETEDFDDVDVDAILPAAEAARRARGGR